MSRLGFVAEGTVSDVTSGNVTPGLPAGTAQGDLLVACIAARDTPAFTNPTGGEWTTIATQQSSGNTSTTASTSIASGHMAYCIRGGSNPNNVFTRTLGNFGRGMIFAFRPVHGPPTLANSVATTLASNNLTVTTSTVSWAISEHDLFIIFGASADNVAGANYTINGVTSNPTWTEQEDSGSNSGADGALHVAYFTAVNYNQMGTATSFSYGSGAAARNVIFAAQFRPALPPPGMGLVGVGWR